MTLPKRALVAVLAVCGVLFTSSAYAETSAEPSAQEDYTIEVGGVEYSPMQIKKTWAACGSNDPASKPVREFARKGPPGVRGTSVLRCGHDRGGYRHIYNRHKTDWENVGMRVGDPQWRSIADFTIEQVLRESSKGTPVHTSGNKWEYWAPLQIRDSNGNVVDTYYPRVFVSGTNEQVVTAFPRR